MFKVNVSDLINNPGDYLDNNWSSIQYKDKFYEINKIVNSSIILTSGFYEIKVGYNGFIFMDDEENFDNVFQKLSTINGTGIINVNNINEIVFTNKGKKIIMSLYMNDDVREIVFNINYNIKTDYIISDLYYYFAKYLEDEKWLLF